MTNATEINTTVAQMSSDSSASVIDILQDRLTSTLDLGLTLKHVHWNVVGMNFGQLKKMHLDRMRELRDNA